MAVQLLFASLPFFLQLRGALCDLPVHCLRHQILGEWDFQLSALSSTRSSCGHLRPDVEEDQPRDLHGASETKRIKLHEPNRATSDKDQNGHYTMIYDEGWEVQIEGLTFFAFSRYDMVGAQNAKKNVSKCGETMQGWYRDSTRSRWGCYVGKKVDQGISLISIMPEPVKYSASYDEPLSLLWQESRVRHLNSKQSTWKAKTYDRWVGKSLRELNSFAGIRRAVPHKPPVSHQHHHHSNPNGQIFLKWAPKLWKTQSPQATQRSMLTRCIAQRLLLLSIASQVKSCPSFS